MKEKCTCRTIFGFQGRAEGVSNAGCRVHGLTLAEMEAIARETPPNLENRATQRGETGRTPRREMNLKRIKEHLATVNVGTDRLREPTFLLLRQGEAPPTCGYQFDDEATLIASQRFAGWYSKDVKDLLDEVERLTKIVDDANKFSTQEPSDQQL